MRVTTWLPILPIPITPRVFPLSSTPINLPFSQFPFLTELSAMAILRESASIKPIVCSATVIDVVGRGKQKGINEARGTLFWSIAKIIEHKTPRLILLENVQLFLLIH